MKPLTEAKNTVLGCEPTRSGGVLLDLERAVRELLALSQRFGLNVDPHARPTPASRT